MEEKEKIIIQLDELRKIMLNENSPTRAKICKEAIDYINNQIKPKVNAGPKIISLADKKEITLVELQHILDKEEE